MHRGCRDRPGRSAGRECCPASGTAAHARCEQGVGLPGRELGPFRNEPVHHLRSLPPLVQPGQPPADSVIGTGEIAVRQQHDLGRGQVFPGGEAEQSQRGPAQIFAVGADGGVRIFQVGQLKVVAILGAAHQQQAMVDGLGAFRLSSQLIKECDRLLTDLACGFFFSDAREFQHRAAQLPSMPEGSVGTLRDEPGMGGKLVQGLLGFHFIDVGQIERRDKNFLDQLGGDEAKDQSRGGQFLKEARTKTPQDALVNERSSRLDGVGRSRVEFLLQDVNRPITAGNEAGQQLQFERTARKQLGCHHARRQGGRR